MSKSFSKYQKVALDVNTNCAHKPLLTYSTQQTIVQTTGTSTSSLENTHVSHTNSVKSSKAGHTQWEETKRALCFLTGRLHGERPVCVVEDIAGEKLNAKSEWNKNMIYHLAHQPNKPRLD